MGKVEEVPEDFRWTKKKPIEDYAPKGGLVNARRLEKTAAEKGELLGKTKSDQETTERTREGIAIYSEPNSDPPTNFIWGCWRVCKLTHTHRKKKKVR